MRATAGSAGSLRVGRPKSGRPSEPTFELYRDGADEWRWRPVAANGTIVADGEGYISTQGAKRGIESVERSAPDAPIVETDGS